MTIISVHINTNDYMEYPYTYTYEKDGKVKTRNSATLTKAMRAFLERDDISEYKYETFIAYR